VELQWGAAPMADDLNQKRVHEFLVQHFYSQKPFTKEDLFGVTAWKGATPGTYWSKQLKKFMIGAKGDLFRVGEAFSPFVPWDRFQKEIVTQVRNASLEYAALVYHHVLIFEFFMPLRNEEQLRNTLDDLFYKETVLRRLRGVDLSDLRSRFAIVEGEDEDTYLNRVCQWISDRISGYSLTHVAGRFKAADLRTFTEAADMLRDRVRYLVDETTAIVRFIFPCGLPERTGPPLSTEHFSYRDDPERPLDPAAEKHARDEANLMRWLFGVLFVHSIVQLASGEDEIWMVESGMDSRLHIWRVGG